MLKALIFLTMVLILCGCQTTEYRAQKSYCFAEWIDKIPEDRQQTITTDYRYELQPTGTFSYKDTLEGKTVAVPEYKKVRIPYQVVGFFDANAKRRNGKINACIVRACTTKFGNAVCE